MNFLDAIGVTEVRYADFHVCGTGHFAAVFAGQGDHFHPFGTCRFDSFNDVAGVA
ncbi:hypothetical protein D3C78_1641680 [compost metagenome]